MFLRWAVDLSLLEINTVVSGLMAKAGTVLSEGPDSAAQIGGHWVDNGLAVLALIAIAVATVATIAVRLDYIFRFWQRYFGKAAVTLSEQTLSALRRNLLQQMKTDVDQRLQGSLHNLVRVDLAQEEQRHQVGPRRQTPLGRDTLKLAQFSHPLVQRALVVSKNNEKREAIPFAEQTYKIFHRPDIGKRLLILGEPGGGKTTELLTVAQRLVEESIEDSSRPIPLIFEMSSWTPSTSILTWMGEQLQKSYGVSKKLADPLVQQWIQQARILLLFDGLDELGQPHQIECIKVLEEFLSQHPAIPALVCCRREEYEQGGEPLRQLNGAISLQAVKPQQIQQYLQDLGKEQLWPTIQAKPELLKLAQSPLFLTMLVVASQDQPIRDLESLFNAYIHKQLHEPSHQGSYRPGKAKSPAQTLHYLVWLAIQLKTRNTTEFLIEDLRPDWLERKQNHSYRARVLLFSWLISCLVSGLVTVLYFCLGDEVKILLPEGGLTDTLPAIVVFGLLGGTFLMPVLAMVSENWEEMKIREQVRWSPRYGLISGLIIGLIFMPFGGLIEGVIMGLFHGLLVGLFFGVEVDFRDKSLEQKKVPNQGIKNSIRNGLIFGPFLGLMVLLAGGLTGGLAGGNLMDVMASVLLFGVGGAMWFGLMAGIKHFSLRICLTKNGDTPWNYAKFLDHSARHRFVQRTGGRYRFIHDLLRQHFAQMTPQQQALLAQKNNHEHSASTYFTAPKC